MKKRPLAPRPTSAKAVLAPKQLTLVAGGGGDGNDTLLGGRGVDHLSYSNITLKRG